jgi:hydroxymethylglutaryl-CoA lyase
MGYPTVIITEEALREGIQIENVDISVDDKLRILDAIVDAGLKRIVVGSFVSPKWTPQMIDIDELIGRIEPRRGVTYLALALNERGRERARAWVPPLTIEDLPETHGHLCDIFAKRNTNRSSAEHEARWRDVVKRAAETGATEAGIGLSSGFGSNWQGRFPLEDRMAALQRQSDLWAAAGVAVSQIKFADPMGWTAPNVVADQIQAILDRWPRIRTFRLHLHNQRGLALTSIYAAITNLSERHALHVDTTIGGIGGCPYCGNGRLAGMAPTEDLVQMLEEMGIATGVDLYRLVEAVTVAREVIGRPLYGRVSMAGPLPFGERLYPTDMPLIETEAQAQHFRLGPSTYEGGRRPWLDDG